MSATRWTLWNDVMVPDEWDWNANPGRLPTEDRETTGGPYVLASDYDALAAESDRIHALERLFDAANRRIRNLEAALRKIEGNAGEYDLTACAHIARAALETDVCTCARITQPDQHFPGCPQFGRVQS